MSGIDIRIVGSANLAQVHKELGKVALAAEATQKAMQGDINKTPYIQSDKIVRQYRNHSVALNGLRNDLNDYTRAAGDFGTSSFKVGKDTDSMVERIQKQQLTFRQLRQEMGLVKRTYEDQMKMQSSYARTWGKTAAGSTHVDLITPDFKVQNQGWDKLRTKVSFYNQVLSSVSTQTVNWGKNTQWAGRQLMAGLTYPLAMAAGLMAKTAYDVDKGLTQIVKVYGSTGDAVQHTDERIKAAAMSTAKSMTQYGQSINDTLEIQSQLASTGKTGNELQDATKAVTKARLLGELDIQDAMKASITLQEVYQMGADELGTSFNFMNQMENETSLTMQDFVEGIPKISGIMKTLGADFEDTGILLAAMKTAGIDAKEGGNAVKSMVFKDIAPSAKALKVFSEQTGQSLQSIVDTTKGDPVKTLQAIGAAMEDLSGAEKVGVVKEVFGIHQGSKALGMIDALTEKTGQMGKAFEIAGMSEEEWATTARGELEDLKASRWVKITAAIENLKIGMVDMGNVILDVVTPALTAIGKMVLSLGKWFDGLGTGGKTVAGIIAAIAVGAGPIIMMVGLLGNLFGQGMKVVSMFLSLAKGQGMMTTKQHAAALAVEKQTQAVNNLTEAYRRQWAQERSMTTARLKQQLPTAASGLAMDLRDDGKVSNALAASTYAGSTSILGTARTAKDTDAALKAGASNSAKIAENAGKTGRSWKGIATSTGSLVTAAAGIGMMSTSTDSLVGKLSTAVFFGSLIGPSILKGLKSSGIMAWIARMTLSMRASMASVAAAAAIGSSTLRKTPAVSGAVTGVAKGAGAAKTAVTALGSAIAATAGPLAIVGVAAAGLFYLYNKRVKETIAQQEAWNSSIEGTASVLGLASDRMDKFNAGGKNSQSTYLELAAKKLKEDEDLRKKLEKMPQDQKTPEIAIRKGIEEGQRGMALFGWSKEEAMEAARVTAIAINKSVASHVDEKITLEPFVSIKDVRVDINNKAKKTVKDALKSNIDGSPESAAFTYKTSNANSDPQGGYISDNPTIYSATMTPTARAALSTSLDTSWSVFVDLNKTARKEAFQQLGSTAYEGFKQSYEDMSKDQKAALEEVGVVDEVSMAKYAHKVGPQGVIDYLAESGAELSEAQRKKFLQGASAATEVIFDLLGKATGRSRDELEKEFGKNPVNFDVLLGVSDDFKKSGASKMKASNESLKKSLVDYRAEVKKTSDAQNGLSYEDRLAILNKYRHAAGLQKTTDLNDEMNRSLKSSAKAQKGDTDATKANTAAKKQAAAAAKGYKDIFAGGDGSDPKLPNGPNATEEQMADTAAQYTESYKSQMSAAQDDMFALAAEQAEKVHTERMDAIDKDGEARAARLDAEEEKQQAAFDKRQEAIDADFDKRQEKFDSRWDNTMEKFETKWENKNDKFADKWDQTMEMFDDRWERKSDAFADKWDATMERFDKAAEKAKKAVEDQYDARIKKVEDAIKAEQDAEEVRQRIFEKEKARVQHMADMANRSIDISMSINTGDLDEAAKLSNDARAAIDLYEMDDAGEASQSGSDKTVEGLESQKERLGKQKDVAIERIEARTNAERKALEEQRKLAEKSLQVTQERERKALEAQRKSAEKALQVAQNRERKILEAQKNRESKSLASQRDALNKALTRDRTKYGKELTSRRQTDAKITESKKNAETKAYDLAMASAAKQLEILRVLTPRSRRELRDHIGKLEKAYGQYGGRLEKKGQGWAKAVSGSLTYQTKVARNEMESKIRWDTLGKSIASRMAKGAFDMSLSEFMSWVGKGASPSASANAKKAAKTASGTPIWKGKTGVSTKAVGVSRHAGGVIDGSKGSRVGFSGSRQSQSEVTINALKGESVLNRRATRALGPDGVNALNRGAALSSSKKVRDDQIHQRGDGPGIGSPAGMMAGMMGMAMGKIAVETAIQTKGKEQQEKEAAEMAYQAAGYSGDTLANAAIIATVGRKLGASERDITIALMTAIVESGLKNVNFGDRDSLGIFQQRAAWGSAADRMDVSKSAKMFFQGGAAGQQGLFDKKNRNNMDMGAVAQAVQVSAFPGRYAQRKGEAMAILKKLKWDSEAGEYDSPNSILFGDGPGGGGKNVWPGMGWKKQFALVKNRFPNRGYPDPNQTTGGGHATTSYHYKGRAVDLGSAKANGTSMNALFNWIHDTYGRKTTELIYGPQANRNISNGKHFNYGAGTNAQHMGHIHWAMRNGGIVPGVGSGDRTPVMAEPGEFMMKKKAVEKVGPDFMKMLNSDRFINMPSKAIAGAPSGVASGVIDNSSVSTYNLNIDVSGNAQPEDVARAVEDVLHLIERRKGFNRRIGNN